MTARKLLPMALLLALSTCALTACGGGGGSMVRATSSDPTSTSPPPPPPPPPPVAETGPCPSPVTADCVIDVPSSNSYEQMTGGRSSDYTLVKQGDGDLWLGDVRGRVGGNPTGTFRFGGGTTVEGGSLTVWNEAILDSNVTVQTTGALAVLGTVTGNLDNHGNTFLSGSIVKDVINDGVLKPGASAGTVIPSRVEGNLRQTANGTLETIIGVTPSGFVSVTGRADIDGTLRLVLYDGSKPGPILPSMPASLQVLHADGGVFGQFATWTSPGLFVTGAIRYVPNDVYFDATALSVAPAMAAARAGDAMTLQSAAHFDAAFGNASGLAGVAPDALTDAQRRFLASAGTIQHLQAWDQAIRTFDSLSGSGYTAATDALLRQASLPNAELMTRIGHVHAGSTLGAWFGQSTMLVSGSGAFNDQRAGFDQWLGDHTLLGSSFAWSDGSLRFDRSGGGVRDQSPQWDVYVQRLGRGDTYLFGDIGYSRHELRADRQIDLGIGQHSVLALENLDLLRSYVEAGRNFHIGGSRLTLFGALSHVTLHGANFTEQGATGFELAVQPSVLQRTSATTGLRLGQDWHMGDDRWASVNLAAGYLQTLYAHDGTRAAFTGAPDVVFALAGTQHRRNTGWLHLNVGAGNEHWNWLLSYDRQASEAALSLGAELSF